MHQQNRHIEQIGQLDGARAGFDFCNRIVGHAVELGCRQALVQQAACNPADHVVVLGMHHDHRAFAACDFQHIQHLEVVDLELVVGHVDLQRGDALCNRTWQVLLQHLRGDFGQDQVKAVVDHRFLGRQLGVSGDHLGHLLAFVLRSKRDHAGRAAERGRDRGAVEIIGTHHP